MRVLQKTKEIGGTILDTRDLWPSIGSTVLAAGALVTVIHYGTHQTAIDGDGQDRDSAAYIAALSPSDRVEHDFAHWSKTGEKCLEDTPYDPVDYYKYGDAQRTKTLATVIFERGHIVILPVDVGNGELPRLVLEPNDGSAPLAAADAETQATLDHFDCVRR